MEATPAGFHFISFLVFLAYVVFSFLLSLHFPMPYITINLLLQGRQTQTDRFALATGLGPSISATNHFCFLFSHSDIITSHDLCEACKTRERHPEMYCFQIYSVPYACLLFPLRVGPDPNVWLRLRVCDRCMQGACAWGVRRAHSATKRVVRARAGYYVCIICMVLLTKRGTGRGGFHDFIRRGKGEHVGWKGGRGGCLLAQS